MKIRKKLNPKPILNLILKQLAEEQLTWIVNDFGADYSVEIRKGISLGIQYRILVRLFKIENVYIDVFHQIMIKVHDSLEKLKEDFSFEIKVVLRDEDDKF